MVYFLEFLVRDGVGGDVSSNPCCWGGASSSCWAGTQPMSSATLTFMVICHWGGFVVVVFSEGGFLVREGFFFLDCVDGGEEVPHGGWDIAYDCYHLCQFTSCIPQFVCLTDFVCVCVCVVYVCVCVCVCIWGVCVCGVCICVCVHMHLTRASFNVLKYKYMPFSTNPAL